MDGRDPVYTLSTWEFDVDANGYRLPTEAEWEYAARSGATTIYLGGDSADTIYAYGNVADAALEAAHPGMALRQRIARLEVGEGDAFVYTSPVASFKPNSRGLFDTHGNVWEWCSDKFHPRYYTQLTGGSVMNSDPLNLPVVVDPQGPETSLHDKYGDWRSIRGGRPRSKAGGLNAGRCGGKGIVCVSTAVPGPCDA